MPIAGRVRNWRERRKDQVRGDAPGYDHKFQSLNATAITACVFYSRRPECLYLKARCRSYLSNFERGAMETINCQHVDEETAAKFRYLQIGENRHLWLCPQCWMALVGRVTYEIIREAIRDGVRDSRFCHHEMEQ